MAARPTTAASRPLWTKRPLQALAGAEVVAGALEEGATPESADVLMAVTEDLVVQGAVAVGP